MLRNRYTRTDLFALVPQLGLRFEPQLEQLDRLLQAYAIEKARIEALRRGHSVSEQSLSDGSIKLTIRVGGVA